MEKDTRVELTEERVRKIVREYLDAQARQFKDVGTRLVVDSDSENKESCSPDNILAAEF